MEYLSNAIKALVAEVKEYIETRIKLFKLNAVDKISASASSIISSIILSIICFLAILILSIGVAFWIGEIIGKVYYGFFVVAGFYLVVVIICYSLRHMFLRKYIGNKIIKKILTK